MKYFNISLSKKWRKINRKFYQILSQARKQNNKPDVEKIGIHRKN